MSSEPAPKLAFITGGSRGLGFEVARGLARNGFNCVLIAKDSQRLESAANQLRSEFPGLTFETSACDLEDQSQTRKTAETLLSKFGVPYSLVLAHGVMSEKMSKTLRTTDAEWRRVMAINLDSVFTSKCYWCTNVRSPRWSPSSDLLCMLRSNVRSGKCRWTCAVSN